MPKVLDRNSVRNMATNCRTVSAQILSLRLHFLPTLTNPGDFRFRGGEETGCHEGGDGESLTAREEPYSLHI